MKYDTIYKIRSNPTLYHYLKYHSYWYKKLIRNPNVISELEKEMKENYQLTTTDKLRKINDNIKMIKAFMEIM